MKFRGIALCAGLLFLVLTGCSAAGPSTALRNRPENPWVEKELEALRRENATLAQRQDETLKRLETVTNQLTTEKAERRRFRDMMATNFELLEQSVALSLTKKIGKNPVVNPTDLKLPQPMEQKPSVLPPPAMPVQPKVSGPSGEQMRRPTLLRDPASSKARLPANKPPMQTSKQNAKVAEVVMPREDPDLSPPASPRRLTANRAAKPLYDRGFAHFAHREYEQSISVYQDFLKRFPNDGYSDNAQFWIAEAFFQLDRLNEAEQAYREVLRNYEHRSTLEGFKTPEAIFRIGQTYLKRKDPRGARQYFASVAERFPTSSAGRKAQRELATMMLNTAGAERGPQSGPDS